MKKQFLILNIIIFIQILSLVSVDSVNRVSNQENITDELLTESQVIKEKYNSVDIKQDFDNYVNFEEDDFLVQYIYPKLGKITTTTSSEAFISQWNTSKVSTDSSTSTQIKLPLEYKGTYDFTVDWGDNTSNHITEYDQIEVTHTYESEGIYTLIINGTLIGWQFDDEGDKLKLLEISQWGDLNFGNSGYYFYGCENLVLTAVDAPDLNNTTVLYGTFHDCYNLGNLGNMNLWNVSNIISLSSMFSNAYSFNQPIGDWDVSNVISIEGMFSSAYSFNQPIGDWNVSNVIEMGGMFRTATSFNQTIGDWDVSSVTDMGNMFDHAKAFNRPIGDWDVSNVTDMFYMFRWADSFDQPLNNWDVSSVIYIGSIFESAKAFNQSLNGWNLSKAESLQNIFYGAESFNQPIGDWNVSSAKSMYNLFYGAKAFNQPIGNWDVSNVRLMRNVFTGAESFNQPIGSWNVSSVTTMECMFESAYSFNQPIDDWNVSSVTDMSYMFNDAESFNQSIGSWNVSSVTTMERMFTSTLTFNQPIGDWDVSSVTDMNFMFYATDEFNQPIGDWDVSNVTNMANMFTGAESFNQPIGDWDVSSVTSMYYMLSYAYMFNQPIGDWDVSSVTNMYNMLHSVTLSTENYDNLLLGWEKLSLQHNIDFHAGNSRYSTAAANARENIISKFGWFIIDGGSQSNPSAPQSIQAIAGYNQVNLSWSAPISDGGSEITAYNIYRSMTSGTGYFLLFTVTSTTMTYIDTNITNGQDFYYIVKAVNDLGESIASNEIVVTPGSIPSAPQSIQATVVNNQVTLYWSAPVSDGGSDITGYYIYRSSISGTGYTFQKKVSGSSLTSTDYNVELGEIYYYIVRAINQFGLSKASTEVKVTIEGFEESSTNISSENLDDVYTSGFEIYSLIIGLTIIFSLSLTKNRSGGK